MSDGEEVTWQIKSQKWDQNSSTMNFTCISLSFSRSFRGLFFRDFDLCISTNQRVIIKRWRKNMSSYVILTQVISLSFSNDVLLTRTRRRSLTYSSIRRLVMDRKGWSSYAKSEEWYEMSIVQWSLQSKGRTWSKCQRSHVIFDVSPSVNESYAGRDSRRRMRQSAQLSKIIDDGGPDVRRLQLELKKEYVKTRVESDKEKIKSPIVFVDYVRDGSHDGSYGRPRWRPWRRDLLNRMKEEVQITVR